MKINDGESSDEPGEGYAQKHTHTHKHSNPFMLGFIIIKYFSLALCMRVFHILLLEMQV
jgi:hypothetical protein